MENRGLVGNRLRGQKMPPTLTMKEGLRLLGNNQIQRISGTTVLWQ